MVFQKLLAQPVMMRLGEILGSSYELGRQFQAAMRSQCFPVQQVKASNIEVLKEVVSREVADSDNEFDEDVGTEVLGIREFDMNSGVASQSRPSTEELHDFNYQMRLQEEYEKQFTYPMREVNLARLHKY